MSFGEYTLVETKAPPGYEQLTDPINFSFQPGQAEAETLIVENTAIPPEQPVKPEEPGEQAGGEQPGNTEILTESGYLDKLPQS
ncbi:SpaA isopeptide-forming pilin-related protein [Halalkalibacterium ligniniphilum]|uniref:SpaA isopeptide-forming pilin-related protein n=1 Tax=Halalkalibacterium ligniniphilum TaxID=1134413 RepID=UPI001375BA30